MPTLIESAPREFRQYTDVPAYRHRDVEVLREHSGSSFKRWPGPQKNVFCWWVLANGKAVGWNENPATGWSFPVISYKE